MLGRLARPSGDGLSKALTPKHAAFVREYLVDLNQTQAAIRAGYPVKSAASQASRLLRNAKVQAAIDEAKQDRADRVEVKSDDVLRELMRLGFSDIGDVFNEEGNLLAFKNIPLEARRAISSIKVKSERAPGDEDTVVWSTEIKLWDKPGSLGMLAKHLKLLTDKVEHTFDGFTDEQLVAKYQALVAANPLSLGAGPTEVPVAAAGADSGSEGES